MPAREALRAIEAGTFDAKINSGRTELTEAEKKHLEEEKVRLKEEMERKRAEFEIRAKAILKEMEGKESRKIRGKMMEDGIPMRIIDELAPEEKSAGGKGGAPAKGGAAKK
jgi:CRISPR/Cas system CMR-associated protein Cmr5 small subunit